MPISEAVIKERIKIFKRNFHETAQKTRISLSFFSTRSFARSIAKIVVKGAIKKLFNKINTMSLFEIPSAKEEEDPRPATNPKRITRGKMFRENLKPISLKSSKPFDIA